jgi:RAC serine/threonine-protein kinase
VSSTTPAAAAAPASPKPSNKNSSNKKGGGPPSTASNSQQQPPRRKSSLLGFNFANFSISGSSNNNNKDPKETPIITTTGSSSSPVPSRKSSGITAPVTATLNGLLRKTSTSIARSGSGTDNNLSNNSTTTMAARMSTSSQASARSINARRKPEDVVHQGWLMKRGEHIKNWRARYFILFKDGALLGFKNVVNDYKDPLNDFTVKDVQLMKVDRPKPNTFLVRGLQWTTIIERMFNAENPQAREEWIAAIKSVSDNLKREEAMNPTINNDSEMVDVSELPQAMEPGTYDPNIHGTLSTNDNVFSEFTEFGANKNSVTPTTSSQIPKDKRSRVTLDDFEFIKMLGVGSFGKVILSREKRSGKLYAIKILKKTVVVNKEEVAHTMTENRVLQKCKHPFLTELTYSFQTIDRLCFVMEFAIGGDLYYHLNREVKQKKVGFDENRSRFYGAEIVMALGYLHDNNIVYRDLKLENLLLDKDGHIKIADFGLCKEDISFQDRTRTFCGTPEYLAPEVLEDNDYGRSVDWWGVGVVLYEMLCGRLPFYAEKHEQLFELILRGQLRYPSKLSAAAKELLAGLLVKNPNRRLGGGPEDWREIQVAEFFKPIDWDKLYRKEIEPPFKPQLRSETDTTYFDSEFTQGKVVLTPPPARDGPLGAIEELDDIQGNFTQFSFHNIRESSLAENTENDHFADALERMEE